MSAGDIKIDSKRMNLLRFFLRWHRDLVPVKLHACKLSRLDVEPDFVFLDTSQNPSMEKSNDVKYYQSERHNTPAEPPGHQVVTGNPETDAGQENNEPPAGKSVVFSF